MLLLQLQPNNYNLTYMKKHFQLLLVSTLLIVFGCSKRPEEPKPDSTVKTPAPTQVVPGKSGTGVGVVTEISKDKKFITLDHNDIPDIMDAMAMEYPMQSPDLLKDIHVKDSVGFTLTKTPESQYMVTAIHKK